MSNSSLVSHVNLSPNYSVVDNKQNKKITIHHMEGNITIEKCGQIFEKASRQASSNYGIGTDGRIGMYVEEKHRSWCSNSRANDSQAITIEVANNSKGPNWTISDKAMASLINLCVDICQRNKIEKLNYTGDANGNLTRHDFFADTTCPGPYLKSKFQYIADEVNKRLAANVTPTKTEVKPTSLKKGSTGTYVKDLQTKLNYLGYNCGKVDGSFGSATESAVKEFQSNNGLTIDGKCGPSTWPLIDKVYAFAKSYTTKTFIKEVQTALGLKATGIASDVINSTITVSKKINKKHKVVKPIQKKLYALGYTIVGDADGSAGTKFDKAVRALQADRGRYQDGEVTAKQLTWKILLGMV